MFQCITECFSSNRRFEALDLTDMQPESWASNFYGDGKMNNYNMRACDLWDPCTSTITFARNSTKNTRLQGEAWPLLNLLASLPHVQG
eukprot:747500-Hanusia_phi.AAC.5